MTNKHIYLDWAATTPLSKRALNAMIQSSLETWGNTGSHHYYGFKAHEAMENARSKVANLINCEPNEIYFTSGGTESNNMALKGVAENTKNNHIIISSIEHSSIDNTCRQLEKQGFITTRLPVDKNGVTDLNAFKTAVNPSTAIISIMLVNNEIGTIQPLTECVPIAKENNVLIHTDAVQAVGVLDIDVKKLGVDMITLSGHKFYAPKGIGILYIKNGVEKHINPLIYGGKQENGLRGGTSNVPLMVAFATALEDAVYNKDKNYKRLSALKEYFFNCVLDEIPQANLNGNYKNSVPHIINFSFGLDSKIMVEKLNEYGICVSAGAACLIGSTQSNTINALGFDEKRTNSAIRFSFGKYTTFEELDYTINTIKKILREVDK